MRSIPDYVSKTHAAAVIDLVSSDEEDKEKEKVPSWLNRDWTDLKLGNVASKRALTGQEGYPSFLKKRKTGESFVSKFEMNEGLVSMKGTESKTDGEMMFNKKMGYVCTEAEYAEPKLVFYPANDDNGEEMCMEEIRALCRKPSK